MTASATPTLLEVCEFVVDCLHTTAPIQDDGYPLIRTPNVGRGRLVLDGVYRVSEDTYQKWTRRAIPTSGDLVLAREAPAGNVAIVKNGQTVCLGQRTVHLRPDRSKVDPQFLCYFLLAPRQQALLLAGETGATAKHVNMKDIRRLPLHDLPSLPAQKKAGELIAAYDDLIANIRRRIAILEKAARLLYREWFVHFRFPGHEHVKTTQGVPGGWERHSAFDSMDVLSGGTPKTDISDYWDGGIPFYTPKDATDSVYVDETEKHVTERGLKACNSALYPRGTVFITARGTVGKLNIAGLPMAMNQSCYALVGHAPLTQEFLYFAVLEGVEHYRSHAVGSVFDAIVIDTFKHIPFLVPPETLIEEFSTNVRPTLALLLNLQAQDRALGKPHSGSRICAGYYYAAAAGYAAGPGKS